MPTKQIYVKEADLPVFAEAEQYGDSLSKVITEALRQFVEKKRAEKDEEGFAEIEIEVGKWLPEPVSTQILRFVGKQIATVKTASDDEEDCDTWTSQWYLYQTKKGKFLILKKTIGTYNFPDEHGPQGDYEEAKHLIVDTLPDVSESESISIDNERIPQTLFQKAHNMLFGSKVQYLDI